ncbi:MarR family transcriptional regulator [Actinomyces sp. ZJ308]|uniref:MarR family winged helix-turn-helix transcriptional regulator n=1 Tax=Actinomyces sp. ZJ308 TaxID=2708342 RepID=UPI001FB98B3F|nr:MarR family transcriptional regulator [Actinomyces sp. ZJ308]
MGQPLHDQRLIRALRVMNSELAASNRAVAGRLGLNESDLAVLDILHREGPQTPTALARRTRMATTTMASVLRRLSHNGWIERRPNKKDLRSFTIQVASADRLATVFRPANERLTALVQAWPAPQVDQLVTFLEEATAVIRESADRLATD